MRLQRLQAHRMLMNTGAGWLAGGISSVRLDGCACGLVLPSVGVAGPLVALLSVRVLGILLAKDYFDCCRGLSRQHERILEGSK